MVEEYRIFKALNHPLRIKILKLIAKKGYASYKELAKLEPKSGVLYHHLRLLGDLIYQDENKIYHLTDKGQAIVEFLEREFFEYHDSGINLIITPRPIFEKINGNRFLFLPILVILSSLLLTNSKFTLLGLLISPTLATLSPIYAFIMSFLIYLMLPGILKNIIYGKSYFFKFRLIDHVSRASLAIIVFIPLILLLNAIENQIILASLYFITQILLLLYTTAEISVSFRIPLRKAFVITILLHYIGLTMYLFVGSMAEFI